MNLFSFFYMQLSGLTSTNCWRCCFLRCAFWASLSKIRCSYMFGSLILFHWSLLSVFMPIPYFFFLVCFETEVLLCSLEVNIFGFCLVFAVTPVCQGHWISGFRLTVVPDHHGRKDSKVSIGTLISEILSSPSLALWERWVTNKPTGKGTDLEWGWEGLWSRVPGPGPRGWWTG